MDKQTEMKTAGIKEALESTEDFRNAAAAALYPLSAARRDDPTAASTALPHDRRGDCDLNPDLENELLMQKTPRPAAVLAPIIARDDLTLLLTLRPEHMSAHAGQISFPGGKLETRDNGDPLAAALRETNEEIGLPPSFIEPIGLLDNYRTATGFVITPVVALVAPGFHLQLNALEVADAFEVPLRFLMDERNHQRDCLLWQGRKRFFHVITYHDRYIWGATAGIIKNLHERLTSR